MNNQEKDILCALSAAPYAGQRKLSEQTGHSIGVVNRSLKNLTAEGYLNADGTLTEQAEQLLKQYRPKNAIILAAGFGMRMVPINMETPKALVEVRGEPLIERTIRQLHEAGIEDISVVVGFMKEHLEYLIDEYGVKLIVNPEYAAKNNLHSLRRALKHLSNTYIIPCDIWCSFNPYRKNELYSWYMVSDAQDAESGVRVNRRQELVCVQKNSGGCGMLGIAYLAEDTAKTVRERVAEMCEKPEYDGAFWEQTLIDDGKMLTDARVVPADAAVEINTYEQLRQLDSSSNQLKTEAIMVVAEAMKANPEEIVDIEVLKKGMTNRSFLFSCRGEKYIMRIPGEGTDLLINRKQEADVYCAIDGRGISDDIIYMNPDNGYKISKFLHNARVCDPLCEEDIRRCVVKMREFHQQKLTVGHTFDLFGQIAFYESLWNGAPSVYRDFKTTKAGVLSLRPYIEKHAEPFSLVHIDAVCDNFLFTPGTDGTEGLRLIDWEYAGMQDPHVDIAMFCIYAMYDREQCDHFIDLYFNGNCPEATRIKIYCYIAACGLLWSNWCEYKRSLGVEFGEYSLRQYRYAKDYYRIVKKMLEGTEEAL